MYALVTMDHIISIKWQVTRDKWLDFFFFSFYGQSCHTFFNSFCLQEHTRVYNNKKVTSDKCTLLGAYYSRLLTHLSICFLTLFWFKKKHFYITLHTLAWFFHNPGYSCILLHVFFAKSWIFLHTLAYLWMLLHTFENCHLLLYTANF